MGARHKTRAILQTQLPAYIKRIQDRLDDAETNPSSLLHVSQLTKGSFVKAELIWPAGKQPKGLIQGACNGAEALTAPLGGALEGEEPESGEGKGGGYWMGGLEKNELCDKLMDMLEL